MECENEYCIYQKNGKCIADSITLDISGVCTTCILVDIPKDELERFKEEQRVRMSDEK